MPPSDPSGSLGSQLPAHSAQLAFTRLTRLPASEANHPPATYTPTCVVDALICDLQHERPDVRDSAVRGLSTLEPALRAIHVETIIQLLKHESRDVRMSVQEALSLYDAEHIEPHSGILVKLLKHEVSGVAYRARDVLCMLESTMLSVHVEAFIELLEHQQSDMLCRVLHVLQHCEAKALSPHAEAILKLLEDEETVCEALDVLKQFEPAVLAPHVQVFTNLPYVHKPFRLADRARVVLDKIHAEPLLKLLENSDTACEALSRLNNFGADTLTAHVEVFLKLLENSDTACAAVGLLEKLDAATLTPHVEVFVKLLENSDTACAVLGLLKKLEATVLAAHVEVLVKLLEHEVSGVAYRAREVLCTLGSAMAHASPRTVSALYARVSPHVEALIALLEHGQLRVADQARDVLKAFGYVLLAPHAEELIKRLDIGLHHDKQLDEHHQLAVACRACDLLSIFDSDALSPHVEVLIKRLEPESSTVVWRLLGILNKLGPATLALHVTAYIELLECKDLACAVLDVLKRLGSTSLAPHVEALIDLLEHEVPQVAYQARDLLCTLGSVLSPEEICTLIDMLQHDQPKVACRARDVLCRLRPAVLAPHVELLILRLQYFVQEQEYHEDSASSRTFEVLEALESDHMLDSPSYFAKMLLELLELWGSDVVYRVLVVLDKFSAEVLAPHVGTLLKLLEYEDMQNKVACQALAVLQKLEAKTLAPHVDVLITLYQQSEEEDIAIAVQDLLCQLASSGISRPITLRQKWALLASRHPRLGAGCVPSMQSLPEELWAHIFATKPLLDVQPIVRALLENEAHLEDEEEACQVIDVLKGRDAEELIPHTEALIKLLEHKESGVNESALHVVRRLGATALAPYAEKFLDLLQRERSELQRERLDRRRQDERNRHRAYSYVDY